MTCSSCTNRAHARGMCRNHYNQWLLRVNPDYKARQYRSNRKWVRDHTERLPLYARRYAARHPEKKRATSAVSHALRDGRLTKGVCEVCGNAAVEAHHADYSKPLDVRWLCKTHHEKEHHE